MSWSVRLVGAWLVTFATAAPALTRQIPPADRPAKPAGESRIQVDGIPVTSQLVREKCGSCHPSDDKGRMTRISYRRTTPEGWQETIRRMVSLNGVQLEPADAREIVRYLASSHGLAPEEARPAAFEVERRLIDYKYEPDSDVEQTCTKCHSMGRVISQRRTKEEWELLMAMHRGLYPLVDGQAFRRQGPAPRDPGPDGRPPDARHPMDRAVAHLSSAFPLNTPEWAAWSATMRHPGLEGRWGLAGSQPGKGRIFGEVAITAAAQGGPPGNTDLTTEIRYVVAQTGETVERRGTAIVYGGFQWRGRTTKAGGAEPLREVLFIERDWRRMTGRLFTGAYDELGLDVSLYRIGADPVVLGADPRMLRAGGAAQVVKVYGANLPMSLSGSDLDFGPGVSVVRIVDVGSQVATIEVAVAEGAQPGARDLFLGGASTPAAVAVYRTIDGIRIAPRTGMARVGGANFPKQYQQFEATAYANGPDGKPDTKDDVDLGVVEATWSLEEYTATYDDDDKEFVGTIDPRSGLFTPAIDGPNPKRRNAANNYGDVWVIASYVPEGRGGDQELRARAHLLVTVPLYMRWEPVEVTR